jgi:non-specific serine/threonine protein kinase
VAPLSVPASDAPAEELLTFDAVQLFLDRARLANARFALGEQNASHVAEICRRLEGLPLAIELAAARTAALSAEAIARRLSVGDARPGTADGPQERHRTIHATIDWSYRLLDAEGQRMLRRLSVFSGFTLEAALAVAGDVLAHDPVDALASLVDKSLVVWDAEMGRYRLLEPIRQFARAALEEAAEVDSVAGLHLRWFADLVDDDIEAARGAQSRRFAELDHELGNIRAGVDWALQHDPAEGLRLSGPLTPYLEARGWLAEGRDWCERLLAAAPGAPPLHRGRALRLIAVCAWRAGDFADAYERAREAVDLLHGVHDLAYLEALVSLGASAFGLNRLDEAREHHEAALEIAARIRAEGPRALILSALANILRVSAGANEEVLRYAREALDASRRRDSPTLVVLSLCNLGHAEIDAGLPLAAARDRFAEALRTASDLGSPMHVAWGLDGMAKALAQADPERAARLLGAVGALRTAHGMELEAPEQEDQDGVRVRIEDALGADRVAELIRSGSALEADAAVVLALA